MSSLPGVPHTTNFRRSVLHQLATKRGPIVHVVSEYPGIVEVGHTGIIVKSLVDNQRAAGFNVHVVVPNSNGTVRVPEDHVHVIGRLSGPYPSGSGAYGEMKAFSREFWEFIAKLNPLLIQAHDSMGLVLAFRPEGSRDIISLYSIYGPHGTQASPDYSFPGFDPDPALSSGMFYRGRVSALSAGVVNSHAAIYWSQAHGATIETGHYGPFVKFESARGVRFQTLPGSFRPSDSPYPPHNAVTSLNLLYHRLILGSTGIEFSRQAMSAPPLPVGSLIYICNETVSTVKGRTARAMTALRGDKDLAQGVGEFVGLGRELHEEFDPRYRGVLGTFVYLLARASQACTADTPVVIGINATGIATRETPITQIEKGDKGASVVGARTINQVVAASCQLVAQQLPPGEWVIVAASDNACAGRITVGDHLLSEDKHGIINLTVPERVLGEGIKDGDEKLRPLEELGIVLVRPDTGAIFGFLEKISVIQIQEQARAHRTGGTVDTNSMVKLVRRDIAALYDDAEHYRRPSAKDGQPLLFTYAGLVPDWSKLHDEAAVPSATMEKWMGRYAKEGKGYDSRDWRFLWIIANDIVLSSLEKIALEDKFFGKLALLMGTEAVAEKVRDAAIRILVEHGKFDPEHGDVPPEKWFFSRCSRTSLKDSWKEVYQAALTVYFKYGDKAKDEWMSRKPDGVKYDDWKLVWETSLELAANENGLAAGRIDGFWLDTGTKREFFNAWALLVHPDPVYRETLRRLFGVRSSGAIEPSVTGQDTLVIRNRENVYVGGKTTFVSVNGGKIILGNNVVIRDSIITWRGEGDLVIPSNTVIFDSCIEDIDPTVADDGAKLIYRYRGEAAQTYEIDTPTGKKQVRFGFYGGVMFGTMLLADGRQISTLFPMDLNLKKAPNLGLIDENISSPDLGFHFRQYYAGDKPALDRPMPFTNMLAADILKNIGF